MAYFHEVMHVPTHFSPSIFYSKILRISTFLHFDQQSLYSNIDDSGKNFKTL